MDTALMAPLAAPPAPSASRAGEAAGAAAASDAPAFAAALADADQTLHDTSAPDADPSAPSDAGTEATTDEAAEPSLPANDTVTQTQQSLADMAAMLASLNATPTSLPVVAVASTAPELSAANLDAAEQPGTDGAVEDTLPSANLAADARPNALPLTPAQIAPSGGEAAAQAAPRRATPPARSADATATSASQRLTHGRDGVTPLRNEVNTTSTPGSVPDAAMAPATDTVAPASAAPAPATATATATATAAVANTTSTTTSTTTTAGTSASLVASDTAALPAPAAPTLSTGVQGVAAREPNTRSRVASLAFQTASAPRAAAPGEPTGGDIGAAAQRSETNSAGAPPPQFSWVNAPANPSANAPGNWAGARVSSEPAFQAQLSAQLFSSDFAPALGVQISTLTRNGIPEARLHLNPAELGPIAVQIELDGRTAQVVLSASHAETRLVLEQAMPQLASAMRDAGFSMSGGGVFQQPQQREPRANDGTPQSARNGVDTALAPPTTTLARVQRGVVDVYA